MKPLNDEEKRQCFSLLLLIARDFLAAHEQQVTFTPQNKMDLCSLMARHRVTQPEFDGFNDVLRSEASLHCHKIIEILNSKRSNNEYMLCFTDFLENYLTSINHIVDTIFPQVFCLNNQQIRILLEEVFCSLVIKTQYDHLSRILLSENAPKIDTLNLADLLVLMKHKKTKVMENRAYKRLRDEEEEMEEDNHLKRMRKGRM